MKLGWIGTGNMGLRMAKRLIQAGNHLCVYNRTISKAERLLETGKAELLYSPAEIAHQCDIVFLSLTNEDALQEVFEGENGFLEQAKDGQIIVEMSTISPEFSQKMRRKAEEKGVQFLDAPVVGSMYMVEQGLLKILVSGNKATYELVQSYFQEIGKSSYYLGNQTEARVMKIAINMVICSYFTLYSEILLVGEVCGIEWDKLNTALENSAGASPMLFDKGSTHRERKWESSTALTSTAQKDIGLALNCASKMGIALPISAIVWQYDNYMYHHSEYRSYSTFGTIGMLEDWCNIKGNDILNSTNTKYDDAENILAKALVTVTTLLAAEAIQFCHAAGIAQNTVYDLFGSCHGASQYFKTICMHAGTEETNDFSLEEMHDALHISIRIAQDGGLFVPILATAEQQIQRYISMYGKNAPFRHICI